MSRLPKPPGARIERGAKGGKWRELPPAKPFKRPAAKSRWQAATKSWWAALWGSPMATTYLEADLPALLRLADMVDARARGELGATETIAMTALEDRFGLNPKARRALQWEITQGEGSRRRDDAEAVPHLKVVA